MRIVLMFVLSFMVLFSNDVMSHKVIIETRMAAQSEDGLVLYQVNKPLSLNDFKGKPLYSTQAVALIYSGVYMQMQQHSFTDYTKVIVTISAYMDPNQSWMKKKGRNIRVLNHEQKHFDLTALAACQLKKKIDESTFTKDWKNELTQIYQEEVESKLQRLQNKYDQDTTHGSVQEAQDAYNQFIEGQISKSECF